MNQLFVPKSTANVLVVGDVILDRYVYGDTTRISPEAPVPIVHVQETEERPGGAGNVALNITRLGVGSCLIGITGDDPAADTLTRLLSGNGVSCKFVRQKGFPTITKLRVLSQHQQLIRLDYEAHPERVDADALFELFELQLRDADIVVLSDYAKGSLANIEAFIRSGKGAGKQVLIDPKGTEFKRYQGASLLTPNFKEFEAVVGPCKDMDAIVEKGHNLCKSLALDAVLVTRGEHGMTLLRHNAAPVHLTAQAREVFDVTGAGDTVIATLAAALASGHDIVHATALANRAAGLVVAKLGAASVTADELNDIDTGARSNHSGILDKAQLPETLEKIKAQGKTIVMTNGCFDILHAGHVSYLQQAKQLGDVLIVAVNDDDSVSRLKGKGRPVNPLEHRLAVLSALKPVDWLVSFSEDTPERLIREISPDILVKGGDYQPDKIAGSDFVKQKGGKIHIIPLLEDYSTSRIIDAERSGGEQKK